MAQQIKKKFIDPILIGQIDTFESGLAQEILDRQSGDSATLSSAQSYADQKIADLVNSAPAVLDTLKELSDALGGDANFATTVSGQIGAVDDKVDAEVIRAQSAEQDLQSQVDDLDGYAQEIRSDVDNLDGYAQEIRSDLDQEILDRQSGDSALQSQIDNLNNTFATDAELASAVSSLEGQISSEASARSSADIALGLRIDQEILDRSSADSALDSRLDSLEAFGYDQIVHVAKNGLDTNSGKQHSPFLTISAAMNAISDASPSKRYLVKVAAGNYSEAIALKANVFIVGEGQKESVRITGAVSMGSSFTASSSFDNRSGFGNLTLLSAANFDWNAVQSAAGKLYFNEVVFGSTVNMYGYNNAIAQAQFNACIIFGNLTISGINVGVFTNNVCYANINLNQHPNSGMATILVATGGYCSGTITQSASVNDFNRRSASFLRSFPSENLIIDGPSAYADVDLVSQSKQGAQQLNGGNLIALNPKIHHDLTTQMITPKSTNSHNMGDWGKQWAWNFGWVHASTGTDLYLISYPSSYAPDSSGKSIGIYTDGAGLQENVNGGEIVLETAATSGTGVRGKIQLNGREIDVTSKQIKNLADGTLSSDAVNKGQLDSAISAIPQITFNKESKTVDSTMLSNEYVDLSFEAKANSIVMFVGRLAMIEGFDYSVSVVSGVSRITFLSPMLVPSPEALELGDVIHFTYAK